MKYSKIIVLLVCVMMFVSSGSVLASDRHDVGYSKLSKTVLVRGDLKMYNTAEPVTLLMLDKDAGSDSYTPAQIKYIEQKKVDADGKYEFKFKFAGDASNCKILMNLAGENVTDSVTEATSVKDMLDIKINVTRNTTIASAVAEINNKYDVDDLECNMYFAFYDDNDMLTNVVMTDTTKISKGDVTTLKNENIQIPAGTKAIKVFVWENSQSIVPLCLPEIRGDERIVCWGDSLTEGANGGLSMDGKKVSPAVNYPNVLATLSGKEVINKGIGGQRAVQIAARQGGVKLLTTENVTIPADISSVEVPLKASNDIEIIAAYMKPAKYYINGIEGTLTPDKDENKFYFSRTEAGAESIAPVGTQIVSGDSLEYNDNSIAVIWMGTNGGWTNPNIKNDYETATSFVKMCDDMIAQVGTGEYVIVGLSGGSEKSYGYLDDIFTKKYGNRFISIRRLLSTDSGAEDIYKKHNITLTGEARTQMAEGSVPSMLKAKDNCHFYAEGYEIIGEVIYNRLVELGLLY